MTARIKQEVALRVVRWCQRHHVHVRRATPQQVAAALRSSESYGPDRRRR